MQNDMRDRLIKLIKQGKKEFAKSDVTYIEPYLADHLIANGVILLPCKVGDIVYVLEEPKDIYVIAEETVEALSFKVETDVCYYNEEEWGKTVFLTKEQAEQKLKEMRVDNG